MVRDHDFYPHRENKSLGLQFAVLMMRSYLYYRTSIDGIAYFGL